MTDTEGPTSYNVKIINPMKKSDYFVRKWRTRIRFQSIESLQDKLRSELDNHTEALEMGVHRTRSWCPGQATLDFK